MMNASIKLIILKIIAGKEELRGLEHGATGTM